MDYSKWNNLIARKFFNEEMAGREVLLYVNEEIINHLGSDAGAGVEDYIQCIKTGPEGVKSVFLVPESDTLIDEEVVAILEEYHICRKALRLYDEWKRQRESEYPPYIAYLAFFSLAATVGGNFVPQAYYPRLWTLLGIRSIWRST